MGCVERTDGSTLKKVVVFVLPAHRVLQEIFLRKVTAANRRQLASLFIIQRKNSRRCAALTGRPGYMLVVGCLVSTVGSVAWLQTRTGTYSCTLS